MSCRPNDLGSDANTVLQGTPPTSFRGGLTQSCNHCAQEERRGYDVELSRYASVLTRQTWVINRNYECCTMSSFRISTKDVTHPAQTSGLYPSPTTRSRLQPSMDESSVRSTPSDFETCSECGTGDIQRAEETL